MYCHWKFHEPHSERKKATYSMILFIRNSKAKIYCIVVCKDLVKLKKKW